MNVPSECPTENTLAAYLEHRLTREEVDALERHLVACERCRQWLAAAIKPERDVDPPRG